jgi:hypothetical protein
MRQSNNKILLIVLIVLVTGFVVTRLFRAPARERNLDETLLSLDTSRVNAIHISPAIQDGTEIKLIRSGNKWEMQAGERSAKPEMAQVRNALASIASVRADRVLTRNQEKWSTYHVDTTGTHVKILLDQDAKDFWIGKLDAGGSSLRVEGQEDVYATNVALEGTFNKNFNEWRDKVFVKAHPEKISKITFQYPGDSSFVLNRSATKWEGDKIAVDSTKIQTYLNRFRSRSLRDFADDFTPSGQPSYKVTLQGDSETITVQGWKAQDDRWVLNSNQQKEVYFSSRDASLIRELFVGKKWFASKP